MNFQRPRKPIEVKFTHLFYFAAFLFTLLANIAVGSWRASAYKTDYDDRLKVLELNVSDVPERLSSIEGKMDVILNVLGKNNGSRFFNKTGND